MPIDAVGDLETLNAAIEEPGPERVVAARDELRLVQEALDQLPKRCREAVYLKQVEGLTRREVAQRMNVAEETVKGRNISLRACMRLRIFCAENRQPCGGGHDKFARGRCALACGCVA